MAQKTTQAIITIRKDEAQNWITNDPVLLPGEIAFDTTNKIIKVGDGVSHWSTLPQFVSKNYIDDAIVSAITSSWNGSY